MHSRIFVIRDRKEIENALDTLMLATINEKDLFPYINLYNGECVENLPKKDFNEAIELLFDELGLQNQEVNNVLSAVLVKRLFLAIKNKMYTYYNEIEEEYFNQFNVINYIFNKDWDSIASTLIDTNFNSYFYYKNKLYTLENFYRNFYLDDLGELCIFQIFNYNKNWMLYPLRSHYRLPNDR